MYGLTRFFAKPGKNMAEDYISEKHVIECVDLHGIQYEFSARAAADIIIEERTYWDDQIKAVNLGGSSTVMAYLSPLLSKDNTQIAITMMGRSRSISTTPITTPRRVILRGPASS